MKVLLSLAARGFLFQGHFGRSSQLQWPARGLGQCFKVGVTIGFRLRLEGELGWFGKVAGEGIMSMIVCTKIEAERCVCSRQVF